MPRDGLTVALYGMLAVVVAIVWLVPALRGNGWRESHLARRGYVFVGEVSAPSATVALARAPAAQPAGAAR